MADIKIEKLLSTAANFLTDKNYEDARMAYSSVLKVDENNLEALKGFGLCCFNLKSYEEALNAFKKAISINDKDATALYYAASISILADKPLDAINYSKIVISLRPDYFDAYKILFTLYMKLQQFDEILKLEKQIEKNHVEVKDDTIHLVLGTVYMMKKQYKTAVEFFKVAYQLNPKKEQICNNLGVCYKYGRGVPQNYEKAVEWYIKAAENGDATAQCN